MPISSEENLRILPGKLSIKFEVIARLGVGGFGKVYKVKDRKSGSVHALKILKPTILEESDDKKRENVKKRFIKEAKSLAKCRHPNIVRIHEVGGEKSIPYIVMEYIEGKSLKDFIEDRKKLSFKEILEKSGIILNALSFIHENHLVHRDLKPENILIENRSLRVVIIDFGLAKDLLNESHITSTGLPMGTPLYMSPEQFIDSSTVRSVSDLYAFGVILFEMLTGKPPFQGITPAEIMNSHLNETIPDIRNFRPDLPVGFENIMFKALEKNTDDRYQRAAEFLAALKEIGFINNISDESIENEEDKVKPKSNLFKYLLYFFLFVMAATAAFIVLNPLDIVKKEISTVKQHPAFIAVKEHLKKGDVERAKEILRNAKASMETPQINELENEIFADCLSAANAHWQKGNHPGAKKYLLHAKELKPDSEEIKVLEKEISEYEKHISAVEENLNTGSFDQAYESLESAKNVRETLQTKEVEGKLFDRCITAVNDYYRKADYPGAKKHLDLAKKIKPGSNFLELEKKIALLKEMPDDVKAVLKESKIDDTKIYKRKNLWEADFGDGVLMVYIPPGKFIMGEKEKKHPVVLPGFWMGKTEVSKKQYMKFVNEKKSNYPHWLEKGSEFHIKTGKNSAYKNFVEDDFLPIVGISWYNANAYCKWLSEKTGLTFILPTEAQWEKAARGIDGRKYPWGGDNPNDNRANFDRRQGLATQRVDKYTGGASPYGLLNMAGNVEEWCEDGYSPGNPDSRAARGGNYYDSEKNIQCTSRRSRDVEVRTNALGFRLCLVQK